MANGTPDSIISFFTIWTEPRATIRRIVDSDPARHVIALAAAGAALGALNAQWSMAMSGAASLSALWPIGVAFQTALAAALGVVALYIGGAIMRWAGGVLGGTATWAEVRAAIAWGSIPGIAASVLSLFALLTFGASTMPKIGASGVPDLTSGSPGLEVAQVVLAIWGGIVWLKCLGEVHRFSAWRALGATLIPGLFLIVVGVTIAFFVYAVTHGVHR